MQFLVFSFQLSLILKLKAENWKLLTGFAQDDKLRFHRFNRDLTRDLFGHASETFSLRAVGLTHHNGHALISSLAHFHSQRHSAKERNIILFGKLPPAAFTENVVTRARIRRDEIAHVLYDTEHRHGHS